jgi:endonuclease/exonuclease/phosphatase family metal-dependent hydrolase
MNHGDIAKPIADGLIELRKRIEQGGIPSSKLDETLNLATWNIREFGRRARSEAALHYIAEILGQFDLIDIVELRDNLSDLEKVLRILGPYWRAVYSDMISDAGGNRERIAFVYDKRAVTFTGFAATATPPRKKNGGEYLSERSWWRPPYMASFQAGNFDFVVIAAHIRWGNSRKARLTELELFANWVESKRKETYTIDKDIIVMGDFNVEDEEMFKALTARGLKLPNSLVGRDLGSNLMRDKRYDQILHYPQYPTNFTNAGDVIDFYTGGIKPLFPKMTDKDKLAFTFALSDHLPLWVQINTDIDAFVLDQISREYDDRRMKVPA